MTIPAITFPDAVATVIGYLTGEITAPVYKRVPLSRPGRFVTVARTGGVVSGFVIDNAQLSIDCWANRDDDLADLTAEVRGLVLAMHGAVHDGAQVYRVTESGGPADLPDPVSEMPRMRWTVQVQFRGDSTGS